MVAFLVFSSSRPVCASFAIVLLPSVMSISRVGQILVSVWILSFDGVPTPFKDMISFNSASSL